MTNEIQERRQHKGTDKYKEIYKEIRHILCVKNERNHRGMKKIAELERKHKTKDTLKKMATKTISKSGTNCIRYTSGRMLFDDVINRWVEHVLSCLVLSCVLANTPMESYGQGWVAWSSLVEMC